jgi:hypothetical protein
MRNLVNTTRTGSSASPLGSRGGAARRPPIYGTPGYTMRDILAAGTQPTTGWSDRDTAQDRYNRALSSSGITPFMQKYLANQFDPMYGAFRMMVDPQLAESGDVPGFVQALTHANAGSTVLPWQRSYEGSDWPHVGGEPGAFVDRGVQDMGNYLGELMATADPNDLTGDALLQYNRYKGNPVEQLQAASAGATYGVHPMFRGGTQTALRRLFESMGGEEMGTPFLTAARAAGYF